VQLTLPIETEVIEAPAPETCPACRAHPVALRSLTTKVAKCRFCGAICQRRDDGVLIHVVTPHERMMRQ
jgi:hypothetical protein